MIVDSRLAAQTFSMWVATRAARYGSASAAHMLRQMSQNRVLSSRLQVAAARNLRSAISRLAPVVIPIQPPCDSEVTA